MVKFAIAHGEGNYEADVLARRISNLCRLGHGNKNEGACVSSHTSNERPAPDKVLTDIADYALNFKIDSDLAYSTARYCLIDTLGCGLEALEYPACTKLLGPIVPGTIVPNGARVPGTNFQLDPVQAAFNIGTIIRWLDFNDTWLAAEWGHPSDNLGGILATADWLSREAIASGRPPLTMRDVLTAMIKAHEIQGCIALENSFNKVGPRSCRARQSGIDSRRVPTAWPQPRADDQCAVARMGRWPEPAHLSSCAQYRIAQKLGGGRCDQPRSSAGTDGACRRDGLSVGADGKDVGILRRFVSRAGVQIPAALRILRDGERAVQNQLPGGVSCADRGGSGDEAARAARSGENSAADIKKITIRTHEACLRIIDKKGPLSNPADRDHCVQYMVAIPLLFGRLTAADYEDTVAADPRIDALRAKIECVEEPRFTADYHDPDKRSIANSLRIEFEDGTVLEETVEYPIGHRRRREEGMPLLVEKFKTNLRRRFNDAQQQRILEVSLDGDRLEKMPVNEYVDLYVPQN